MAVDALVALAIFASTIVFALAAAEQALRAARTALEVREAKNLLIYVLENSRDASESASGATKLFNWQLHVDPPLPSAAAASLCAHAVTLISRRSQRTYEARTREICPAGAAP